MNKFMLYLMLLFSGLLLIIFNMVERLPHDDKLIQEDQAKIMAILNERGPRIDNMEQKLNVLLMRP